MRHFFLEVATEIQDELQVLAEKLRRPRQSAPRVDQNDLAVSSQ